MSEYYRSPSKPITAFTLLLGVGAVGAATQWALKETVAFVDETRTMSERFLDELEGNETESDRARAFHAQIGNAAHQCFVLKEGNRGISRISFPNEDDIYEVYYRPELNENVDPAAIEACITELTKSQAIQVLPVEEIQESNTTWQLPFIAND